MRYEEIRPLLRTCDLVFFSGHGLVSWVIKKATRSKWSHVGLVFRPTDDLVLLIESTTLSKTPDFLNNRPQRGCQVVELSRRLQEYRGAIGFRRIIHPRTDTLNADVAKLRTEFHGRDYERDNVELMLSATRATGMQEDLGSLFCSELAAEILQRTGYLPEQPPSNSYSPAELTDVQSQLGYFAEMEILDETDLD